jgi:flagellar hook-length control protein FliK
LTQELPATVAELINSREQAAPQELSALMPENMAVIQEAFETAESGSFGSEPDLGEAAKAVQAMALPFAEKVQAQEFAVPRQEISPADIKQIIAHATAREISPGVSEARIALHPESLGEVVLRVKSDNGVITASFTAVDPRVREMLENSLPQLKSALADQGLGVSQLSVSVGGERQQAQEEGRRRQGRYYGQEEKSEEPEKIVLGISGKNMDLAI